MCLCRIEDGAEVCGAGIKGCPEPPCVGAGNQILVLRKISICFKPEPRLWPNSVSTTGWLTALTGDGSVESLLCASVEGSGSFSISRERAEPVKFIKYYHNKKKGQTTREKQSVHKASLQTWLFRCL